MIIHRIVTHPRLIAQSRIVAANFQRKTLFEKIVARAIIREHTVLALRCKTSWHRTQWIVVPQHGPL